MKPCHFVLEQVTLTEYGAHSESNLNHRSETEDTSSELSNTGTELNIAQPDSTSDAIEFVANPSLTSLRNSSSVTTAEVEPVTSSQVTPAKQEETTSSQHRVDKDASNANNSKLQCKQMVLWQKGEFNFPAPCSRWKIVILMGRRWSQSIIKNIRCCFMDDNLSEEMDNIYRQTHSSFHSEKKFFAISRIVYKFWSTVHIANWKTFQVVIFTIIQSITAFCPRFLVDSGTSTGLCEISLFCHHVSIP